MSTTHTVHEDVHEHGLADDCDRCREHAEDPLVSLDEETLRALFERTVSGEPGRSETEELAMFNLQRILSQATELARLNPIVFAKYMKSQDIQFIAVVKP